MCRLMRDGTAEPVSRDQILRRKRGQGNTYFSYSADHEQDWQPYPVDPYFCYMCDHIRCPVDIVNCRVTHQSHTRIASTVQLKYLAGSCRDVGCYMRGIN